MAAPHKTPPIEELKRLRDELGSINAVATHLGLPRSTVYGAFEREKEREREEIKPGNEFMPWYVTRTHLESGPARMLRLYNRQQEQGIEVPKEVSKVFEDWLLALEYNNYVVCYHPDTPPTRLVPQGGFFYRPRRADDTEGIMQVPADDERPPSQEKLSEWSSQLR